MSQLGFAWICEEKYDSIHEATRAVNQPPVFASCIEIYYCLKPEDCGFDSRCLHFLCFLCIKIFIHQFLSIFPQAYWNYSETNHFSPFFECYFFSKLIFYCNFKIINFSFTCFNNSINVIKKFFLKKRRKMIYFSIISTNFLKTWKKLNE